jgi:hypothetical protein
VVGVLQVIPDPHFYTGRLLRLLSTHHIFQEVAPDVYAHNRISLELDTGKKYEDIKSK